MAPLTDISARAYECQHSAEPISRTMQYRKITKPLLERQRRARINRSLDELKEILITGLQSDGENVARLEKADILELTVRHLHKLQQQVSSGTPSTPMTIETACIHNLGADEKFRNGYSTCAKEVSRVLASTPKIDIQLGTSLMVHLGNSLNQITQQQQGATTALSTPMPSPASSLESYRPYTPPSSPEEAMDTQSPAGPGAYASMSPKSQILARLGYKKTMWRPW